MCKYRKRDNQPRKAWLFLSLLLRKQIVNSREKNVIHFFEYCSCVTMYISFVIKHLQNFFFFSLCYAFICNCYPLDLKSLYAIGLHLHCQQKRILDFNIFYLCLAVFKRAVVKFGKLLSRIISFKENWGDLSSESITKHYISTVYTIFLI